MKKYEKYVIFFRELNGRKEMIPLKLSGGVSFAYLEN